MQSTSLGLKEYFNKKWKHSMKQRHSNFGVIYGIVDSMHCSFNVWNQIEKMEIENDKNSNFKPYIANKTGLLFILNNVNKKITQFANELKLNGTLDRFLYSTEFHVIESMTLYQLCEIITNFCMYVNIHSLMMMTMVIQNVQIDKRWLISI